MFSWSSWGSWVLPGIWPSWDVWVVWALWSVGLVLLGSLWLLGLFGLYDVHKRPPQDAWSMAQNRFNQLVTVKLQDKVTQKSFAIGNYHMPCAFYKPEVMTIHTDLAARHVQKLASTPKCTEGDNKKQKVTMPYVLAGDWNIKPDGSSYRLLTTGKMDKGELSWHWIMFKCSHLLLFSRSWYFWN